MKKAIKLTKSVINFLLINYLVCASALAEPEYTDGMTIERLEAFIINIDEHAQVINNSIEFTYNNTLLICVHDEKANRMRIVSPITELTSISSEQLLLAMAANFHTALDARYAISNGLIYAAFIHPLQSLSETELQSAIHQVSTASANFGGSYSSGALYFPSPEPIAEPEEAGPKKSAI